MLDTMVIRRYCAAHLVLDSRVLALCVLSNKNSVDIVVRGFIPFDGHTWSDVGEEVECPSESQVEGDVSLSDYYSGDQLGRRPGIYKLANAYSGSPMVLLFEQGQTNTRHENDTTNIPFNATVFFLTLKIASSGITVFPSLRTGVTLTSSH